MNKVLGLFRQIYDPAYKRVSWYLKQVRSPVAYFNEVMKAFEDYESGAYVSKKDKYSLPFLVSRHIFKQGRFRND